MGTRFGFAVLVVVLVACGGRPPVPKRGVVEGDLGDWKFRRFQPVLDTEVWVEGNKAEAYTASYVRAEAEKRGRIEPRDLCSVMVTRFRGDAGVLRETVRFARRLAQEHGYTVEEAKLGGVRAVTINGNGEAWVIWASKNHVVKVGGRDREDVPENLVEDYGDRYPSQIPEGVLEGPLPGGEPDIDREGQKGKEKKPAYDPDNPTPDWDKYDKQKTDKKIEDSKQRRDKDKDDKSGKNGKDAKDPKDKD